MLSVIAVNYNSSDLLKDCFSSIASAIGNESFEFLAIDSGSREEEVDNLRSLERDNVRVILNKENIGYAKAVNTGIKNAKGEYILITNPDVLYLPDSIKQMLHVLSGFPRCGAVGPKTWWNKSMTFLLPSSELITPYRILRTEIMKTSRTMSKVILRGWIKKAVRYWLSGEPIGQEMLSGACIMTTNEVIDRVGGFDEAFPLYFEDTDWCMRLRRAGYHLYMVPQARIIHYYNQSAKQDISASRKKFNDSLDTYIKKHFKGQLFFWYKILGLRRYFSNKPAAGYHDLGLLTSPPDFTFKNDKKKLLLLSPVDYLIPSAGSFFEGKFFSVPGDLWDSLGQGRYFVKVLDLEQFKCYGSWSWLKQSSP